MNHIAYCQRRDASDVRQSEFSEGIELFWPLVLPVKITFGGLIGLSILATAMAPRFGKKPGRILGWSVPLCLVGFIPSCAAVMLIVDQLRFGVFSYPDFDSVNDFRVERFLPEPATDITVEKRSHGFRAKFKIDETSLNEWFDRCWDRYGKHSMTKRAESDAGEPVTNREVKSVFGNLGWAAPDDLNRYQGPVASNGAGFTIWYSRSKGVAYQNGAYW